MMNEKIIKFTHYFNLLFLQAFHRLNEKNYKNCILSNKEKVKE